jgi:signal peptidase II
MTMGRRLIWAIAVAVETTGCDLSTKYWAIQTTARGPRPLIGGLLDLVHAENPGMAFSLMHDWPAGVRTYFLTAATLCTLVLAFVSFGRRHLSIAGTLGLGLVLGGALGNLLDRLRGGTVTDFLYVHRGAFSWPVFNVADIAVSCGAVLLLFVGWDWRRSRVALGVPRRPS